MNCLQAVPQSKLDELRADKNKVIRELIQSQNNLTARQKDVNVLIQKGKYKDEHAA